jgi:hypothetical protein
VAILGQQMREISEFRLAPHRLLVQPRLRVGRRLMGVVAPPFAVEIDRGVLRIVRRRVRALFRFEASCGSPMLRAASRPP